MSCASSPCTASALCCHWDEQALESGVGLTSPPVWQHPCSPASCSLEISFHVGTAEGTLSASSMGAAERSASEDLARAGKPKKRVSWRAGRLNDVAQASADRAGLATPEELQQQELGERFTWKVHALVSPSAFPRVPVVRALLAIAIGHGSICLGSHS